MLLFRSSGGAGRYASPHLADLGSATHRSFGAFKAETFCPRHRKKY